MLLFIPFTLLALKQTGLNRLRLFLLLIIPFFLFFPWIIVYFSAPHPEFINTSAVVALPATLVSFILGGTGQVTLRTYFGNHTFLWIKSLFSITSIVILFMGLIGTLKVAKIKNGRIIFLLFFPPLLFLTFVSFFVPLFSIRSTIFLAPYFYMLTSMGFNRSLKQNLVCSAIGLLLILVNIVIFSNPLFKGAEIQAALRQISPNLPILHTSILTYYPFRYYKPDSINMLVASNPLAYQTVSIIEGKKEPLPTTLPKFVLIEIYEGTNEQELAKVKQTLNRNYKVISKKHVGSIVLSEYLVYFPKKILYF